ncbi:hypothetical protein [Radiobacillus sp. PE A8.2]
MQKTRAKKTTMSAKELNNKQKHYLLEERRIREEKIRQFEESIKKQA